MEIVSEEEDVILVHHPSHLFVVEDAILILVPDLTLEAILEIERDLTLVEDVVTLVDVAILVAEATLEA